MHYIPSPFAHVSSNMVFRTSDLTPQKVECIAGFVGLGVDSIPIGLLQHEFISFIGDPVYAILGKSDPYLEENITFDTLFDKGVEHKFSNEESILTEEFCLEELLTLEGTYFFDRNLGDAERWKALVFQEGEFVGCDKPQFLDKGKYVSYNQVFGISKGE